MRSLLLARRPNADSRRGQKSAAFRLQKAERGGGHWDWPGPQRGPGFLRPEGRAPSRWHQWQAAHAGASLDAGWRWHGSVSETIGTRLGGDPVRVPCVSVVVRFYSGSIPVVSRLYTRCSSVALLRLPLEWNGRSHSPLRARWTRTRSLGRRPARGNGRLVVRFAGTEEV